MAPAEREARREAIESDLWQFLHDSPVRRRVGAALHVIGRALRGIPGDLSWRIEQTAVASQLPRVAVLLTVLLIIATFLVSDISTSTLPPVPSPPVAAIQGLEIPPPPPPPPEKPGGRHDRDYWRNPISKSREPYPPD
jgi:hypothetical protein